MLSVQQSEASCLVSPVTSDSRHSAFFLLSPNLKRLRIKLKHLSNSEI